MSSVGRSILKILSSSNYLKKVLHFKSNKMLPAKITFIIDPFSPMQCYNITLLENDYLVWANFY